METRTRFVFLMHPHEFKHEKAATGRLTHLCLANSELQMGLAFDNQESVQEIINDPRNLVMLVYPSVGARNLSKGDLTPADIGDRRLVFFLLDATWAGAKKMLRLSPSLQRLPRVMFTPTAPSRYVIKQQPVAGCLSTLETTPGLPPQPLQLAVRTHPRRRPHQRTPHPGAQPRRRLGPDATFVRSLISGHKKARLRRRAESCSLESRRPYLALAAPRLNFEVNFSTRPAVSTMRFSPV
jgi:hypothetical protein